MPFSDPVSSISGGRNSRASNTSAMTAGSNTVRSPPAGGLATDMLANAGVLSMLKTSTDTGDIGALSFNNSRLPGMPRPTHQRRSHAPRASSSAVSYGTGPPSSLHHASSQISRLSSQWDTASSKRRGSMTSMHSMPPSLVTGQQMGSDALPVPAPIARSVRDERSYSMTSAPASQPLPRHQSATSLKNRSLNQHSLLQVPADAALLLPENRSPLIYPTRLKRPGFRSPSPALSDTYNPRFTPPTGAQFVSRGAPPFQTPHQPHQRMRRDYNEPHSQDSLRNVRPPPRTAQSSPAATRFDSAQLPTRPLTMRPGPPLVPYHLKLLPPRGEYPVQCSDFVAPTHAYPVRQPRVPASPIESRAGQFHSPSARYAGMRGAPPPPSPNVAPMVHQMFHNAARLARYPPPPRADTPMTDLGPPSSDPPSSRSAPSSSNPPTPGDYTADRVAVDSAFVHPALLDLSDSSSDPELAARYFEYAEGIHKIVDETELEVPHPSVPPSGFVQRVRAMLESKATADAIDRRDMNATSSPMEEIHELAAEHSQLEESIVQEIHEMAANETPRFTLIEEFIAPSELPASPVKSNATDVAHSPGEHVTQRITREMVKAELGPSSVDNTLDQPEAEDTSHMLVRAGEHRGYQRRPSDVSPKEVVPNGHNASDSIPSIAESTQTGSKSENGSASTISVKASIPSGADYALRFTLQLDTARSSAETFSKDHFGLDVGSTRHDNSRNALSTSKPSKLPANRKSTNIMADNSRHEPVSPLKPDEFNMSRYSEVSPLPTQTIGIDQSMQIAPVENTEQQSTDQPSIPGSFPDDLSPPPTPRARKTYSQSVQLPPSSTGTETTSTNRYSLPGDLASIGDSTSNSTTDMVTDVAVRFSLPPTASTICKPQIVDVPCSSTPDRLNDDTTTLINTDPNRKGKTSTRNSVMFADEVAPLSLSKKPEQKQSTSQNIEPAAGTKGKSIIRKPSPRDETHDLHRLSRDSTTDLRLSGINFTNFNGRFGSTFLPDLKEESFEDVLISDQKRSSTATQGFDFPIPARIAAVKAMQDRRLQESGERAKARRVLRHRNRTLAEIRDLPSLNFSRMDLVDKLNEALEGRSARSFDLIRRSNSPSIYSPSPQRPQSTEPLRERYMSFFSKPDGFDEVDEQSEVEAEKIEQEQPEIAEHVPTIGVQEQSEDDENELDLHLLSPKKFLNVAQEVNRLSIPSVAGLSERLSELIPGLRNLQSLQLDSLLGPWSDNELMNGNELGRPDTVLSTRMSTGFRALAERAEEIVKNGTHDSVQSTRLHWGEKELPLLPVSVSADNIATISADNSRPLHLSGSISVPADLGREIVRPPSAVIRARTPTTAEEVHQLLPAEMNPIARAAIRSMTVSQASSRPWNLDENYPWAGEQVKIDLLVPRPAHLSGSSPMGQKRREKGITKSLDLSTSMEPNSTTQGIDIGSLIDLNDSGGSATTEQLTGVHRGRRRKHSKRSIIGSITKKLGFSGHDENDSTTKNLTLSPALRSASPTRTSQLAGDRYPSSGLSPPAAFNLDEVQSFFSDNSSDGDQPASLRKRLTHFKGKGKSVRIAVPGSHSPSGHTGYDAGAMFETRVEIRGSAATSPEGVGMSKAEFHFKRFGEKLRHLFAKGGELLRSWSSRSHLSRQPKDAHEDWLADSEFSAA